jgi:hypothetical protein
MFKFNLLFILFVSFCFFYDLGPLAKAVCSAMFSQWGCQLCLTLFDTPASLNDHCETCRLSAPVPMVSWLLATKNVHMKLNILLCLLFNLINQRNRLSVDVSCVFCFVIVRMFTVCETVAGHK